jgi:hypothetical protein
MSKRLSAAEGLFCRLIVDGVKQGMAYAQAFGCKTNSAGTLAGRLLKRVEIKEEIERLKLRFVEVQEKAVLWSKAQRMEKLQGMAEVAMDGGEYAAACRCIDIMNRMDGAYEPQKVEVSGDESFRAAVLGRTAVEPMVKG